MANKQLQEKYAELALKTGVNLQEGQALVINSSIEGADFTKIVARKAYEIGAKNVHINWTDDELTYLKFNYASEEVLTDIPEWQVAKHLDFAEDGAALLSIRSTNPDLLKDIDPAKVAKASKASGEAMKEFRQYTMNDRIPWSIISIPTGDWAQKIFRDKPKEDAIESLWGEIFKIVRVDQENPVAAWEEHNHNLKQARDYLNKKSYKALIFKSEGTDIRFELPEGHVWKGGATKTPNGNDFNPNMPTEEVFTLPHKYKVDGKVTATKPLVYGGNLIDGFSVTFKDGKVVDFEAEKGYDTFKHLLDTDEGATRLGELALVPHASPISQSGLIFYNTLFDENASCHIALGKAYPTNLEGGSDMSEEELDKHGVNDSLTHVDFMIGSADLDIDGETVDGEKEPVFRQGAWAINFE
ncbi:aminopeptidase II. Metallo peptidase. MEROPS family M29 [Gracilibacillus orientalis]|uniref:Aminopeptidase II. Metallo peptidase. MEROPS family M29 n=1 Tax=Gracilibacillus orientalis TaxID=334253 RepID=A0A1I4NRR2_9BACI|nr:aminopeptidase [Gracilibacillus orientalis]SFM18116.1 aminopeptidase II. Metallo peptidase. MEROPS family M29 [Gracilibacillus orientalis]